MKKRPGWLGSSRWRSSTTSTSTRPLPETPRWSPHTRLGAERPDFPFWPMLFDNLTIRLLGSEDFPPEAKQQAAADLAAAARDGALSIPVADPYPLERAAAAHERIDAGNRDRVRLAVPV